MQTPSNIGATLSLLPLLLVWLGGILYALATWGRHPRVSLMVVIALVIFILSGLAGLAAALALPLFIHTRTGLPFQTIANGLGVFNILRALVEAAAWLLLLAAAFSARTPARPAPDTAA